MKHAGINARVKKKQKRDTLAKKSVIYHGYEEKLKYENFWVGVERSLLVQNNPITKSHQSNIDLSALSKKSVGKSGLIDPENPYKITWDIFIGIMIMFSVITIPFRISFQLPTTDLWQKLDYFLDVVFFLDMLANFNTAILDTTTDTLIIDRKVVLKQYMSFWFWIDLVSTLPLEEMVGALLSRDSSNKLASVRLVRIVRLMRIIKLARVVKLSRLSVHIEKLYINPALLSVITLVLRIFFIAHIVSCFWYFLTTSDVTGVKNTADNIIYTTWLTNADMQGTTVLDKYIAAFYWTFATMLAIGYGDIHATNSDERLYAICTMLGGGILFGAVIAQVTRLIEVRNPQARIFKMKMNAMKAYLGEKTLPGKLKLRAKEAYAFSLQKKSSFSEAGGVLDELPHSLMLKLVRNIYDREIYHINLFREYDFNFVAKLVSRSSPFQVDAEELLYQFGDVAEDIIFVLQGQVRITTTSGNREVIAGYVTDGGYFGDFEYLSKSTRAATYTAATKCSLLSVSFQVLDEAYSENLDAGAEFKEEMQRRFELFKRAIRFPVQNTAKTRRSIREDDPITTNVPTSNIHYSFKSGANNSSPIHKSSSNLENLATMSSKLLMMPNRARFRRRQSFQVAGKNNKIAVRTQIWLNGEMSPPDVMEHDVESSSLNQRLLAAKHQLFRVLKLDQEGNDIIVEEPVDAMRSRFLLHPRGHRKNYWDILVGALIIYSILMIPVQIAFNRTATGGAAIFDHFVDGVFFLDILYCCRTAYYCEEQDAYIAIPSRILLHYFQTWFVIDFLSCIPIDETLQAIIGGGLQGTGSIKLVKIFRLTRLLKLARLFKLSRYVSRLEDEVGIAPLIFDLMKMVCEVIFIGHLVCCIWWGATANMTHRGWMDNLHDMLGEDLRNAPLRTQYTASLYWTFTTLTTTGYGDIYSVNTSERALNIIVMILGATVFGYVVANMSSLMENLNQTQALQREKISEITEYLNEKNCPQQLSGSIVRYFRHRYSRSSAFDEEAIMARLPKRLCFEISWYDAQDIMSKIPLFRFIENRNVALFLFKCLTPIFFDADHYIAREGEVPMEIMFFISGRAKVYKKANKRLGSSNNNVNEEESSNVSASSPVLVAGSLNKGSLTKRQQLQPKLSQKALLLQEQTNVVQLKSTGRRGSDGQLSGKLSKLSTEYSIDNVDPMNGNANGEKKSPVYRFSKRFSGTSSSTITPRTSLVMKEASVNTEVKAKSGSFSVSSGYSLLDNKNSENVPTGVEGSSSNNIKMNPVQKKKRASFSIDLDNRNTVDKIDDVAASITNNYTITTPPSRESSDKNTYNRSDDVSLFKADSHNKLEIDTLVNNNITSNNSNDNFNSEKILSASPCSHHSNNSNNNSNNSSISKHSSLNKAASETFDRSFQSSLMTNSPKPKKPDSINKEQQQKNPNLNLNLDGISSKSNKSKKDVSDDDSLAISPTKVLPAGYVNDSNNINNTHLRQSAISRKRRSSWHGKIGDNNSSNSSKNAPVSSFQPMNLTAMLKPFSDMVHLHSNTADNNTNNANTLSGGSINSNLNGGGSSAGNSINQPSSSSNPSANNRRATKTAAGKSMKAKNMSRKTMANPTNYNNNTKMKNSNDKERGDRESLAGDSVSAGGGSGSGPVPQLKRRFSFSTLFGNSENQSDYMGISDADRMEYDSESEDENEFDDNRYKKHPKFSKQSEEEMETYNRVIIGEVQKGDFFGHGALMRHARHAATIRAMEPCSLYVLRKIDIMRLIKEQPGVVVTLQMALGQAAHELRTQLGQQMVRTTRARFLREIKRKFHEQEAAEAAAAAAAASAAAKKHQSAEVKGSSATSLFRRFSLTKRVGPMEHPSEGHFPIGGGGASAAGSSVSSTVGNHNIELPNSEISLSAVMQQGKVNPDGAVGRALEANSVNSNNSNSSTGRGETHPAKHHSHNRISLSLTGTPNEGSSRTLETKMSASQAHWKEIKELVKEAHYVASGVEHLQPHHNNKVEEFSEIDGTLPHHSLRGSLSDDLVASNTNTDFNNLTVSKKVSDDGNSTQEHMTNDTNNNLTPPNTNHNNNNNDINNNINNNNNNNDAASLSTSRAGSVVSAITGLGNNLMSMFTPRAGGTGRSRDSLETSVALANELIATEQHQQQQQQHPHEGTANRLAAHMSTGSAVIPTNTGSLNREIHSHSSVRPIQSLPTFGSTTHTTNAHADGIHAIHKNMPRNLFAVALRMKVKAHVDHILKESKLLYDSGDEDEDVRRRFIELTPRDPATHPELQQQQHHHNYLHNTFHSSGNYNHNYNTVHTNNNNHHNSSFNINNSIQSSSNIYNDRKDKAGNGGSVVGLGLVRRSSNNDMLSSFRRNSGGNGNRTNSNLTRTGSVHRITSQPLSSIHHTITSNFLKSREREMPVIQERPQQFYIHKQHRSCSDLIAVSNVTSRRLTTASATTPYNKFARRQSFPSYDNKEWKKNRKCMAVL